MTRRLLILSGFLPAVVTTVLALYRPAILARADNLVYDVLLGAIPPGPPGSRVAMENAFASTGIAPAEVDYVNAHATSTLIGDVSEARALRSVFGEMGVRPAISSTKALTGHGLSLAGAMEAGFCALAMRDGFIPGSAHITRLDPECEGLNILRSTAARAPRLVMKNSSGFGGANVALLFRHS